MLEKEVRVSATDRMGFGSFSETHILRVKNADVMKARDALVDAGVDVIPYSNAGMAYAEDLAEKTLSQMVDRRAEEQAANGIPMSTTDQILADEAIYNYRGNVGSKIYDEILSREGAFAASLIDDIVEHSQKRIPVEESVKLGLLTPGSLIEKLEKDSENQGDIENLLQDEFDKHCKFNSVPWRGGIVTKKECVSFGHAYKKTELC